ncbi:hypothetical protein I3271_07220 [Photobacterium leiognathi]|uniref:hypothetical protein n=1 Tax=Photobacterium leiognathi TaxID=553611 RepID=UPI001EDCB5C5|nr:hypothetical protein [Photobacterium leiognathi]MCG3884476.1 hypothetical protein [Photobacterium leiognathi]
MKKVIMSTLLLVLSSSSLADVWEKGNEPAFNYRVYNQGAVVTDEGQLRKYLIGSWEMISGSGFNPSKLIVMDNPSEKEIIAADPKRFVKRKIREHGDISKVVKHYCKDKFTYSKLEYGNWRGKTPSSLHNEKLKSIKDSKAKNALKAAFDDSREKAISLCKRDYEAKQTLFVLGFDRHGKLREHDDRLIVKWQWWVESNGFRHTLNGFVKKNLNMELAMDAYVSGLGMVDIIDSNTMIVYDQKSWKLPGLYKRIK